MKKFIMGLIVGALVAIGVTTMAYSTMVQATWSDDYTVIINGEEYEELDAMLNYNGSVYAPLRAFGEALGGEVTFDEATKTVTLDIEPTIVEVPVEVPVYEQDIKELPYETTIGDFNIRFKNVNQSHEDMTGVQMDITNYSDDSMKIDYKNAYLEATVDGVKTTYAQIPAENQEFIDSIKPGTEDKYMTLWFEKVPDDVEVITVHIPVINNENGDTYEFHVTLNLVQE